MKKTLLVLLCAAFLLGCAACGKGDGNKLWADASPDTSVLSLYYYDGETGWSGWIADRAEEEKILEGLSRVSAKTAENWSPEKLAYPFYGLEIGTEDGKGIRALWSNGYLIMRDGSVYTFDYDFEKLEKSQNWEDKISFKGLAYMPNQRNIAEYNNQWLPEFLTVAELPAPPADIGVELRYAGAAKAVLNLKNEGDTEWCYGLSFSLHVLLDGCWYHVPTLPDENWGFESIGCVLPAGESREEIYSFMMYGALPKGTYRIVMSGVSAEFELE